MMNGSVPVLYPAGERMILRQSVTWLENRIAENTSRYERLSKERWIPEFWDINRVRLLNGLNVNSGLLRRVLRSVASLISFEPAKTAEVPLGNKSEYSEFSHYLFRDWSGLEIHETQEISTAILGALQKVLESHAEILVVGAGLGRLAADLCHYYRHVIALDRSIIAATIFDMLSGGFLYSHERFLNAIDAKEQIQYLYHRLDLETTRHIQDRRMRYACGDIGALPLSDTSIDCVVSSFFSDVVGFDVLMPSVVRVLRRGGIFLHFGPLHYHFAERGRMFPVDILRGYVSECGFEVVEDCYVPVMAGSYQSSLMGTEYRNWLFVARKL